MKKFLTRLFILCFAGCALAAATEISIIAEAGNFALQEDGSADTSFFSSHALSLGFSKDINDSISIDAYMGRDFITRNAIEATVNAQFDFITLTAGPYIGVGNTGDNKYFNTDLETLFQPGLTVGFSLGIPGKLVAYMKTTALLESELTKELSTGYSQAGVRFWAPNVICSLQYEQKKAVISSATEITQTDTGLYFDVFKKGLPFRVLVKGVLRTEQYQTSDSTASGTYTASTDADGVITLKPVSASSDETASAAYPLNHILLGVTVTWNFNSSFSAFLGMDSSVYSWYKSDSGTQRASDFFYTGRAGVAIKLAD